MSEEKDPPEIAHGPLIDHGLVPIAPKPCSKRLQDGSRYGWCLRPPDHDGACDGNLSEPYDMSKPFTRIDNRYDGRK